MFSVIIPLYNKEQSIGDTLQSVLEQTFQDFEVVIVNDGSTDQSSEVVKAFDDTRIRLIHQQNQGVSAARNRGIMEARQPWLAFLDGDDWWEANHLAELQRMISQFPDHLCFATSFRDSGGRIFQGDLKKGDIYEVKNFCKEYLLHKNLVWTSSVAVLKTCFTHVDGFNPQFSLGEDLDLWVRLSQKFPFVKSNVVTAIYQMEAENRSDKSRYNMQRSFLSQIDFDTMKNPDEKKLYRFFLKIAMKNFIVQKDFKNLFFLIRKYGIGPLLK